MPFWTFVGNWLKRVLYGGWDAVDIIHRFVFFGGCLAAALLLARVEPRGEGPEVQIEAVGLLAGLIVASLAFHAYRLYREQFDKRAELERQLTPRLEFNGVDRANGYYQRIRVRNLSAVSIRFKTRLCKTTPSVACPLPVLVQATHGQNDGIAEVDGGQDCPIDIFVDPGKPAELLLLLISNNANLPIQLDRKQRHELILSVTEAHDCGTTTYRRYYIVPQSDGSVILTDGGHACGPG